MGNAVEQGAEDEFWMSVGLNSGTQASDFRRKNLNLVLVVDISGSMGSPCSSYHYDGPRKKKLSDDEDGDDARKPKMQLANEAVVALLSQLRPEDRVAIVLFNNDTRVLQTLTFVADLKICDVSARQLEVTQSGGTNMEVGFRTAAELLRPVASASTGFDEESRIVFLTDDMPNSGATSGMAMLDMVRSEAERGIYTSLLGIGLDFNSDVVEAMSKAKGAWYGSVKTATEFRRRLDEEFDYMVTPLVFNLRVNLASDTYAIDKVFGSPEAELATGQLMRVNTLFPSPKDDTGRTKGGIILLRLVRKSSVVSSVADETIKIRVSYEDRCGVPDFCEQCVVPPFSLDSSVDYRKEGHGFFENSAIRKAVLLARYTSVLHQWLVDERHARARAAEDASALPTTSIEAMKSRGIFAALAAAANWEELGEWEQRSLNLSILPQYKDVFAKFMQYMSHEAVELEDDNLKQEEELLQKLISLPEA